MSRTLDNSVRGKGVRGIGDIGSRLIPPTTDISTTAMNDLNREFPISLAHMQHIIDRIHTRYPLVEKYDITLITKTFFETVRSIMLDGGSVSIVNFFTNMHLYSFDKIRKNKYSRIVKIKLNTSRKIKQ